MHCAQKEPYILVMYIFSYTIHILLTSVTLLLDTRNICRQLITLGSVVSPTHASPQAEGASSLRKALFGPGLLAGRGVSATAVNCVCG